MQVARFWDRLLNACYFGAGRGAQNALGVKLTRAELVTLLEKHMDTQVLPARLPCGAEGSDIQDPIRNHA